MKTNNNYFRQIIIAAAIFSLFNTAAVAQSASLMAYNNPGPKNMDARSAAFFALIRNSTPVEPVSVTSTTPETKTAGAVFSVNPVFSDEIRVEVVSLKDEEHSFFVYGPNGHLVAHQKSRMYVGAGWAIISLPNTPTTGKYVLVVKNSRNETVLHAELTRTEE